MGHARHSFLISGLIFAVVLLGGCTDPNLKKGRNYYKEKDYDKAIHHFKLAVEKNPENRSARYNLIEAYAQQMIERPEDQRSPVIAEELMAEIGPVAQPLMDDPNIKRYISLVYQTIARGYAESGRDDKAAEAWQKVLLIEPTFVEAHYNVGVALAKNEKYQEAIPHFEKAVDLNPYFIRGYYALGNALVQLNRDQDAIKQYEKALELNPDDPEARHNLAIAYSRSGDNERAVKELQDILKSEPDYGLASFSLANIYKEMGETEKAEQIEKDLKERAEAVKKAREQAQEEVSAAAKESG